MVDKEQFIKEFNLADRSDEEQQSLYEAFTYEVGAAISDGLSDEQMEEFTEIAKGNAEVIEAWLAAHEPGYRDDPAFQELHSGQDEDPDKVPPEKVFASIGWVRLNRPDFEQILARVSREFKAQLAAETSS